MSSKPSANRVALILVAGLALLAGVFMALIMRPDSRAALHSGILLKTPRSLPAFQLTDDNGKPFGNDQLKGHWTLIFPGYTACPDVCPTTMALLKSVAARLGDTAGNLQVLMLSIDPQRDTPAALHHYVSYFDPRFRGATTAEPALGTLARALGVAYTRHDDDGSGNYAMDHSSALVLINPQGQLAGYFSPPFKVDSLAADLGQLLSKARR